MTRKEYMARWDAAYVELVEYKAAEVHADGCTGVPDFYLLGCLEHDIAYRTHKDPLGIPLTKEEADQRLRWYVQMRSPFGLLSPMSWWRWAGVKWFAGRAWNKNP